MEKYLNKSGNSGVEAYDIGLDYIKVKFKTSSLIYVYTYKIPGVREVNLMKGLAQQGLGLSTYISQHIKTNFERTE
ncbi:Uncharacterised protein (plasmid) [Legionella adelaidensis]|uniref:KTSC domain-containing protein n=1 Tax=Legionella adelaidensis TaxID=45056 RepID=A0A0W0R5H2_9GAMM|nr:hypothetical protein [Legionella adelaidensis]KTC66277.1 hypothetical protein Lade_0935 [Legionella adelaidensis]VEH84873.1 Uncharacterised protein [Legionella adelaidensis]